MTRLNLVTNLLLAAWVVLELGAALRSRAEGTLQDRGSFWAVGLGVGLGLVGADAAAAQAGPAGRLPAWAGWAGVGLLVAGVAFRHYAIGVLGRNFTPRVRIRPGQPLIQHGPYRFLRHPSYTGGWLALVGTALTLRSWPAVLVMAGFSLWGFARRIRVEEAALAAAFGSRYEQYRRRSWRMIPFVF
ncbi:putative Protein-S-isoprenylcysteine O-methyltransferase [Candidatus Hydrogenisulfobacillus filiaventi]|uniref:Isoprenylcysteine carboxylmethyltransferase family protein n=1 Tax=Candidatus Hydrogenisulfobacillus filiaventi TaxID=2707344 RepID=A0A6F8ZHY2_9FIRM|nr:putative Protein-S-isoprenylcysteine O-methyltransferase [Candidatus Hydrogenisulfobacillus filiaventi]